MGLSLLKISSFIRRILEGRVYVPQVLELEQGGSFLLADSSSELLLANQTDAPISVPSSGITFVNAVANGNTSGDSTLVLTMPTVETGDKGYLYVYGDAFSDEPTFAAAGWTSEDSLYTTGGRDVKSQLFSKTLSDSESDATITISAGTTPNKGAALIIFRDVNASPIDVSPVTAGFQNDTTPTPDPLTTLTDEAVVVSFVCFSHGNTTAINAPSNMTLATSHVALYQNVGVAYQEVATASEFTPSNFTAVDGGGVEEGHTCTFAIKP